MLLAQVDPAVLITLRAFQLPDRGISFLSCFQLQWINVDHLLHEGASGSRGQERSGSRLAPSGNGQTRKQILPRLHRIASGRLHLVDPGQRKGPGERDCLVARAHGHEARPNFAICLLAGMSRFGSEFMPSEVSKAPRSLCARSTRSHRANMINGDEIQSLHRSSESKVRIEQW